MARAVPRTAGELVAVALVEAAPVSPVSPELPLRATGLASATEVALPVSPLLVELDCDVAAPDAPEMALGLAVTTAVAAGTAAGLRTWPLRCRRGP